MGLTFNLGRISPSVFTDSSLNVGIGAAPSGSYKLEVTGTGYFSGILTTGSNVGIGVTPSAWYNLAAYVALQVGNASLFGRNSANSELYLSSNVYDNSSGAATYITTDFASRYIQNDGTHTWLTAPSGTAGTAVTFTPRMTILQAGNVGIGTSSPSDLLTLNVTSASTVLLFQNGGTSKALLGISYAASDLINNSAAGDLNIRTNNTNLNFSTNNGSTLGMRITSGGDVLIGATSIIQSAKVLLVFDGSTKNARVTQTTVGGTGSNFDIFVNSANGVCGYIQQNGTTTVNYSNSSDYRLKENILPIQNAIDRLSKINAVTYTWKDTDNEQGEGFIAHELQEVVPLAVTGIKDAMNQDGTIKAQGIDYAKLTPLLVAAIQELNERLNKAGL